MARGNKSVNLREVTTSGRVTHSRRSAARRASLPSSLPTSIPGKGGAEVMAWRVASAAATPVKGIPAPNPLAQFSGGRCAVVPRPDPAKFAVSKGQVLQG